MTAEHRMHPVGRVEFGQAGPARPPWWTPDNGWGVRIGRLEHENAVLRLDLDNAREALAALQRRIETLEARSTT